MTAADQTERWTLHVDPYGVRAICYSSEAGQTRWCDNNGYRDHITAVPAAALDAAEKRVEEANAECNRLLAVAEQKIDAAREEIERLKGRVDAENERFDKFLREDHAILRHRAEQAEAELAKAKAVIEAFRVMLREPYKIQEIDGWKDAVKALSILDEKANP